MGVTFTKKLRKSNLHKLTSELLMTLALGFVLRHILTIPSASKD